MQYRYIGNYRFHFFYQKIFDSTKICISVRIGAADWMEIAEIDELGKISDSEVFALIADKIEKIEELE